MDDLSGGQRERLQHPLAMVKALARVPDVARHESRFAHEVALRAPSHAMAAVCEIVEHHLGAALKPASAPVSEALAARPLVATLGGLRADQTLYERDLGDGLCLYVAFWPWSGGKTITIKIGVAAG